MEWRPISEAPKDGTTIIAAIPTGSSEQPYWIGVVGHLSIGWLIRDIGKPTFAEPTHWMPLPSPPEGRHPMSTMSEDLVEVVARALVDDHRLRNHEPRITDEAWAEIRGTSFGLPSWSHYASQARAAIAAINGSGTYFVGPVEATEEMMQAGKDEWDQWDAERVPLRAFGPFWSAMISAVEG